MINLSVSVVLVTFNQQETIRQTCEQIREIMNSACRRHQIVVVDDGSADRTAEEARACGATVITHVDRMGFGLCLLEAVKAAEFDHIASIDPASHDYAQAARLMAENLFRHAERYEMVVGVRVGQVYWGSALRHVGRVVLNGFAKYITGQMIGDIDNGTRVFKRSTLERLQFQIQPRNDVPAALTLVHLIESKSVRFAPIHFQQRMKHGGAQEHQSQLRQFNTLVQIALFYDPLSAVLPLAILQAGAAGILLTLGFLFSLPIGSAIIAAILLVGSVLTTGIGGIMFLIKSQDGKN